MRLRSERIVCPGATIAGEVVVQGAKITAVRQSSGAGDVLDLGDQWLVPGYIDGHVHGGGGAQCNTTDPEEILSVARFHAGHGTTALVPTTVAAPAQELEAALRAIARSRELPGGAAVLGAHLEGPFLSRARPGAMDPAVFADPDRGLLERLQVAAQGGLRLMTLAPELPGALELIGVLVADGVVASMGHSEAGFEQTRAAVRAGARSATHLFNAMAPLHHREPGLLGAVLELSEVNCELIGDGIHVDPAVLRLAHRLKGGAGTRLVTDAMQAAGMPDGEYRLGAAPVEVQAGRARLVDGGSIAGSTLTMDAAVRNAVRLMGLSVEEAVALATANPARVLGIQERKGAIAAGMDADLVVLDEQLAVRATLIGGVWSQGPP
jgi:N-acetylglucosamine-6-phosphate deacetylase